MADPYPVQGKVTFKDKTVLRGGVISFVPTKMKVDGKVRYEGSALIDADGNYKIGFNGDGKGVPAGDYKVTIMPRDYRELSNSNSSRIPLNYRSSNETPLTLVVKEGENVFNIEL